MKKYEINTEGRVVTFLSLLSSMKTEEEKEKALQDWDNFSEVFNNAMDELEKEQEAYWASLTPDQQLMAFCAISRRIYQAEIVDRRSYRGTLYDVFGWGMEAYAPAQLAGYLEIHNAIMENGHDRNLLEAFCRRFDIQPSLVVEWFR